MRSASFWSTIERNEDPRVREKLTYLRTAFSSLLITGPFSIILGFSGGLMALNDRLNKVYIAGEEAAIRTMAPNLDNIYAPVGGEPVIVKVKEGQF